ncbi:MAG: transporter substrate-binding domain-containing protein [Acutalibacteraceae bacterium]|nr:transporter substrate-binding domain-containing protein [Acutalibacteraceae bacterium]
MKKFIKILAVVIAIAMMTTVFASCGSKETDTKDSSDANETKTSAVKVIDIKLTDEEYAFGVDKNQTELLKQVNDFIAEIKSNGTFDEICDKYFGDGTPTPVESAKEDPSKDQLVVATNAAFEPFEYTEGDKYLGIDMEIAKLLADKLGKELVINNMKFESVCTSVGQHKCDIAMAGLTVNEERKKDVTFSDSYYNASQKIIVKGDDTTFDNCKTVEDVEKILNGLDDTTKIGVQNGTTGQYYLEGDKSWGFDGFKVDCVGYDNGSLAMQDMINGNIKYVVLDEAPANCIAQALNEMN